MIPIKLKLFCKQCILCRMFRSYLQCIYQLGSKKEEKEEKDTEIEWKDCHPFVPPITAGYVIKVYDGDTITIAAKLPYSDSPLYRFAVRLNGIDAPEIKGKSEDEKQSALVAKRALEGMIFGKTVSLKNVQTEKYGRILADVYLDDLNLNTWMLDHHYVVPYDGGTKKKVESWLEYNSISS